MLPFCRSNVTSRDRKIEMPEFTLVSAFQGCNLHGVLAGRTACSEAPNRWAASLSRQVQRRPRGTGPVDFVAPERSPSVNSVGEPVSNAVGTNWSTAPVRPAGLDLIAGPCRATVGQLWIRPLRDPNAACGAGGWVLKVIVADPTLEFAAIENDLG